MVHLNTPEDALPWVGLYVSVASLICVLAMAADAFQGFRQWKLWFPNKFFSLNAAYITVIAIAMKLPVDLTTDSSHGSGELQVVQIFSIFFLVTMLANFLPSLGLMDDKELLVNMVALGILIITIFVNVLVQMFTRKYDVLFSSVSDLLLIFALLWVFSIALTVPTSRIILELQYKKLHELASNLQEIKFSSKELEHTVKKYWMMAETGNPQFVIACSQVSSAFGVICPLLVFLSVIELIRQTHEIWYICNTYGISAYPYYYSDYTWSLKVIYVVQTIGVIVGSIAPILRCLTSISYFNISIKLSKNHLNVFRVEKYWIQRLRLWKRNYVGSHILGHHCKMVFHFAKNVNLNFCLAVQVMIVVMCKTICLIPRCLLILFSWCWYICKSLLKRFKIESNVSNINVRSEMEEYRSYVLQIEDDAKLSKRILKNTLNSITRLLHASEKKRPRNLIMLLEKSKGFNGVVEFDNDEVPLLNSKETHNSWSLAVVTLTAIAIALPNIANDHVKGLLVGINEGLQFVRHIEDSLNANDELVKARKASKRLGIEVEVFRKWLQIDLQKKARKGKTSKEILQWLGDEAVKIVIRFKNRKNVSLELSSHKFIVASSMYRISQTILLHFNELENWPRDEEVFEWISTIIADILYACFTNLPRVINMKCHHEAIEKRQDSIRTAAQILGKSKKILDMLKERELPNLDMDSMAYLDKWRALSKSQIPNGCASASSMDSFIVTIM